MRVDDFQGPTLGKRIHRICLEAGQLIRFQAPLWEDTSWKIRPGDGYFGQR